MIGNPTDSQFKVISITDINYVEHNNTSISTKTNMNNNVDTQLIVNEQLRGNDDEQGLKLKRSFHNWPLTDELSRPLNNKGRNGCN